jgi:hypothetical protein
LCFDISKRGGRRGCKEEDERHTLIETLVIYMVDKNSLLANTYLSHV